MISYYKQMVWQLKLLQKNNIISISFGVTLVYGLILFSLKSVGDLDQLLTALILNDPSVIGYFFIALAFYTEIRHSILSAMVVTPLSMHKLLSARVLSISLIGTICSLLLALSAKGFDFDILHFTLGSFFICGLSALLGIFMLTYADEFLKFTMFSIPIFLIFINIPLLQYLGIIELNGFKYLFPIQGALDLIDHALSGKAISISTSYLLSIGYLGTFYFLAHRSFQKKMLH